MNERASERSLKVRRRKRAKGVQGVGSTCARDGCCKRCARVMWGQRLGGGGVHVSCGSTLEPKKQGKRAFRGPCIVMGQTGHCHFGGQIQRVGLNLTDSLVLTRVRNLAVD
ncbi:hypothetical protein Goshw_003503, partial [Gossypium schwendimanii]|nr:hypothetical protein [Gossypium schwendimanii]